MGMGRKYTPGNKYRKLDRITEQNRKESLEYFTVSMVDVQVVCSLNNFTILLRLCF